MDIKILQGIAGAKKAEGLTVVIDVFRAFSVESYCFFKGTEKIITTGALETAYAIKKENPDYFLIGEREGKMMPGCDCGNSPSQLAGYDLKGKTVIHSTSAGTQGIYNAENASEILGCCLLNARATAEYIRRKNPKTLSLVCMGLAGLEETDEDTLCAEYIKSILTGESIDLPNRIEKIKTTSGKKFFDEKQKDVFPTEDFFACVEVDKFDFVMKYVKDDGIGHIECIK